MQLLYRILGCKGLIKRVIIIIALLTVAVSTLGCTIGKDPVVGIWRSDSPWLTVVLTFYDDGTFQFNPNTAVVPVQTGIWKNEGNNVYHVYYKNGTEMGLSGFASGFILKDNVLYTDNYAYKFTKVNDVNGPEITSPPQPTPEIIYITVTPTPTFVSQPVSGGQNSISGRVYDSNHNAVSNAKVTIYNTKFTLDYVAKDPVNIMKNPQLTSDGSTSLMGLYQFSGLNPDVYIITAEKNGIAYSETVQVREGTTTEDIIIPGLK